ncbi:hypothetical protein PTSG_02438 [Salpingoeca rosetta]|uniref:ESCRT-II complex subunit VPS25 n=1 Tax=Salpingoeca rosetta (strain ATCC 50818 / BSB-021) TaxID=946362 RepID=F2U275_SALR5|nr:uncharacterized protein PTSG_02438 [Salpingoeca rosetta]EGD81727.1 hypothetical protein PTSG_02438 [Salpingoeca rosetta]|eukprot:XP_004996931.1 hypothetical protein PTSG_02438 [Salpingoeca rosetta]
MVRFKSRYFLVSIHPQQSSKPWKPFTGKKLLFALRAAVSKYFGDFGVGSLLQTLAVKYYCDRTRHCIVRCCREHMDILSTTLTLITSLNGSACSLQIHHAAGTIRSCQRALVKFNASQLKSLLATCTPTDDRPLRADPSPMRRREPSSWEAWKQLVIAYAQAKRLNHLVVSQCASMDLFNNKQLNRALSTDAIVTVLDFMQQSGHVEWKDASKTECAVFWQSPKQWGGIIYKWAVDTGNTDTVCTFFELLEGETGEGQEFHNMDRHVFKRALQQLQKEGKAEVFSSGDEADDTDGVKFFMQ